MTEEQLLYWKKAMFPEIEEKDKEIERLNNIIKEQEKDIEYNHYCEDELRKKITNLEYKIKRLEEDSDKK